MNIVSEKLTEKNVNENNMGKETKDDVINKKEGNLYYYTLLLYNIQ